ncbi:hypothetical protein J6590_083121 [Homalodisca vitripennis]|nr:hypothetical protein J6590_083121 [Homalodisca vitripennis]
MHNAPEMHGTMYFEYNFEKFATLCTKFGLFFRHLRWAFIILLWHRPCGPSAALAAVLCRQRRPPKVGNTHLVLLLVGLLAIAATLAAAAGDNEPSPRKVSRLLDLDTQDSPMSPIPVETETEPEDDGAKVSLLLTVFGSLGISRRANRTYMTLELALPSPFEVVEEELILGERRRQPLRPILVPQPRIRVVTTDRPSTSTPRGTPAVTITPVPRPSTSRDPATSQHNTSRGDSAFTPVSSQSCTSRGASCPCTAPITVTSSTSRDRRAPPSTSRGTGMPLEGRCLACQQEAARRRSREFFLDRFLDFFENLRSYSPAPATMQARSQPLIVPAKPHNGTKWFFSEKEGAKGFPPKL